VSGDLKQWAMRRAGLWAPAIVGANVKRRRVWSRLWRAAYGDVRVYFPNQISGGAW
jgi:hypothetical protein